MRTSWIVVVILLALGRIAAAVTMTTQLPATTFGTAHVAVASTTTRVVRISNTASSGAALDFTIASDNPDFVPSVASGSIAFGGFRDVTISFTPSARGARTATLTVSGNDAANPSDTFSLSGTGTSGNLTLSWSGSPNPLSFGTVAIAGGTSTRTISITNPVPANEPLIVSLVISSGTSDFSAPVTQDVSIAVGGSLPVTVTFNPSNANTRNGVATITSNDAFDAQEMVNLTGIGQGAVIQSDTTSYDYGSVPVGLFSEQIFRLRNVGNQSLMITAIDAGSSVFTVSTTQALPITLAANAFTDVTVRFTPVDGSIVSSQITVTSNATPASLVIPITGDGVYSAVTLTDGTEPDLTVDLGDARVGVAQTRTITVTNTGETTIDVDAPLSDSTGCTITSTLPASLDAGDATTFTIHVTPVAVGAGECTITVDTNIPSQDTVIVDWQGVAPDVEITAPAPTAALDFGVVDVDDAAPIKTVVLHNTGGAPLAIGPCAVQGSSRFHVTTSCTNLSIAPGESATLMVDYDPSVEAQDSGTLTVGVDALSTDTIAVTLSGTGADQRIDFSALDVAFPDANITTGETKIAYIDVRNPVNPSTGIAETLHIASASIDNPVFTLANMGPFTLDGENLVRLAITFAPTESDTFSGTLTVTSDASSIPMAEIALHGRGVAVGSAEGGCCDTRSTVPRSNLLLVLAVLGLILRRVRGRGREIPETASEVTARPHGRVPRSPA